MLSSSDLKPRSSSLLVCGNKDLLLTCFALPLFLVRFAHFLAGECIFFAPFDGKKESSSSLSTELQSCIVVFSEEHRFSSCSSYEYLLLSFGTFLGFSVALKTNVDPVSYTHLTLPTKA